MRRARRGPHRSQAAGRAPPVLLEVARGRAELRAAVLGTRGPGCALRREGLGRWLGLGGGAGGGSLIPALRRAGHTHSTTPTASRSPVLEPLDSGSRHVGRKEALPRHLENSKGDFPEGPVIKAPRFQCKRRGFGPWLGN